MSAADLAEMPAVCLSYCRRCGGAVRREWMPSESRRRFAGYPGVAQLPRQNSPRAGVHSRERARLIPIVDIASTYPDPIGYADHE
jgi:hypothetical protein